MSAPQSPSQGRFIWHELMTGDPEAATEFYRAVIGWDARDAGVGGMSYTLLSAGGRDVAGLMALPAEAAAAGARPGWLGYVAVDDVDAMAARLRQQGGAVHRAPEDIPGIGRFAVVADPQGAVFALFQGAGDGEPPPPVPMGTPGHVGWNELMAADGAAAFDFYSGLFGWSKAEAHDMGPMGIYQLFGTPDGLPIGGMMTKPAEVPQPAWGFYFATDAIDAAADRVKASGGQVLNGPAEVPGGAWILQCLDPQGAFFALVAFGR